MSQGVLELRGAMRAPASKSFDVLCAGEAAWDVATPGDATLRFRASGGAVNAAVALARGGLRVGLVAMLDDDALGRALVAKVAAAGVDTRGVTLAPRRAGLVVVEATSAARRVVAYREEDEAPVAVPEGWASQVLLLSGLSPALAYAAGLCKAARAARRAGTIVVVDINARPHVWDGRDARAVCAVLREADVVRCSAGDLARLDLDVAAVRASMRDEATLVLTRGAGAARATGRFGEVARAPQAVSASEPRGAGDAFTAAICAELAREGHPGVDRPAMWERALRHGHAAASARLQRR